MHAPSQVVLQLVVVVMLLHPHLIVAVSSWMHSGWGHVLTGQEEPVVSVMVKQVLVGREEIVWEEGGGVLGVGILVGEREDGGEDVDVVVVVHSGCCILNAVPQSP